MQEPCQPCEAPTSSQGLGHSMSPHTEEIHKNALCTVALEGQFTIGFWQFDRHFDNWGIITLTIRTSVLTIEQ